MRRQVAAQSLSISNVAVPAGVPKGDRVPLYLIVDGVISNVVYIAIE